MENLYKEVKKQLHEVCHEIVNIELLRHNPHGGMSKNVSPFISLEQLVKSDPIIAEEYNERLSNVQLRVYEIWQSSEQILADAIDVYDRDGPDRFERRVDLFIELMEYPDFYFQDEALPEKYVFPSENANKAFITLGSKELSSFRSQAPIELTLAEVAYKLVKSCKHIREELIATKKYYLKRQEEDFVELHLPNISNRLALLHELGIITHLLDRYESALANQPGHMVNLLALILDIPAERKPSFSASVKHLLNGTYKSPRTEAALLKIKAELIKIGIQI